MGIEWILIYVLLGAFVGFVAGLLGIGGGAVMVPLLTTIFLYQGIGVHDVMHLALGTSMASIIVTSFASMRAHDKQGGVIWSVSKPMSIGAVIGTFAGTFLASWLNSTYLAIIFTVFIGYTAYKMIIANEQESTRAILPSPALFAVGGGIGGFSALVSIGGGTITVPFLTWQNIDIKKAIGTSASIGLPISIAGTIGYILNGYLHESAHSSAVGFVYFPAVICISIVSYFTVPYGARLAHRMPIKKLKRVFALLLIVLCLKMFYSLVF